ncbi:MAG: CBS domain-containing protein [Paracoccaceae bacterium]
MADLFAELVQVSEQLDAHAAALSLVIFFAGVLLAVLLKLFQIAEDVGYVALILLPVTAYGVAVGYHGAPDRAAEIAAGPVAPAPLFAEAETLVAIEAGQVTATGDIRARLTAGRAIAIPLRTGRPGHYSPEALAAYTAAFLRFDPDLTLVVLPAEGETFLATLRGASLLAALGPGGDGDRVVAALAAGDLGALAGLLAVTQEAIGPGAREADALRRMMALGAARMAVVDGAGRVIGVVARDAILARIAVAQMGGAADDATPEN